MGHLLPWSEYGVKDETIHKLHKDKVKRKDCQNHICACLLNL